MAGHHFNDPRVFYDMTADLKYASLDDMFNPGKKEPKFIESEYRVKEGTQGGKNANQKKNANEDHDGTQQHKEKSEAKSKIETVELHVNLCCDRCVWKVRKALEDVQGIEKIECDQDNQKVLVKGSVKPEYVLKKVKKVKRDAELVVKKKQN